MAERAKVKKAASAGGGATRSTGKPSAPKRAKIPVAAHSKDSPARAGAAAASGAGSAADRIASLEAETLALRQQLAAAQEQIARLERRQELVVNRIDWVIDSLHNLIEGDD